MARNNHTHQATLASDRGNRKGHSTETALLHVTDDFLLAIDKSEVSVVVLLDMSKAFDSIRQTRYSSSEATKYTVLQLLQLLQLLQ